mmetsp:Transcript_15119/g.41581  ORF Transcript_15119/g.41581 Transcript_15119/m.41581 type:complete len:255 (-) Transcript_15119:462-1226(-)
MCSGMTAQSRARARPSEERIGDRAPGPSGRCCLRCPASVATSACLAQPSSKAEACPGPVPGGPPRSSRASSRAMSRAASSPTSRRSGSMTASSSGATTRVPSTSSRAACSALCACRPTQCADAAPVRQSSADAASARCAVSRVTTPATASACAARSRRSASSWARRCFSRARRISSSTPLRASTAYDSEETCSLRSLSRSNFSAARSSRSCSISARSLPEASFSASRLRCASALSPSASAALRWAASCAAASHA